MTPAAFATTALEMAWATFHYLVLYRFAIGFAFFFSVLLQLFFPARKWLEIIQGRSGWIALLAAAGLGITTSPGRRAIEENFRHLAAAGASAKVLVAYLLASHSFTLYYLLMLGPLLGKDVLFSHILGGGVVFTIASLSLGVFFKKPALSQADLGPSPPAVRRQGFIKTAASELWAAGPLALWGLLLGGILAAWGLSPWHIPPATLYGSGLASQALNAALGLGVSFLAWMSPVANLFVGTYLWKIGIAHAGLVSFFFGSLTSWPRVRLYRRVLGPQKGTVLALVLALAALAAGLLVTLFFHLTGLSIRYKLIAEQMLEVDRPW